MVGVNKHQDGEKAVSRSSVVRLTFHFCRQKEKALIRIAAALERIAEQLEKP
jgi:hypothetical protein